MIFLKYSPNHLHFFVYLEFGTNCISLVFLQEELYQVIYLAVTSNVEGKHFNDCKNQNLNPCRTKMVFQQWCNFKACLQPTKKNSEVE